MYKNHLPKKPASSPVSLTFQELSRHRDFVYKYSWQAKSCFIEMLFPSGPRNTPKEAAHSVPMCYRQKQCHIHALFAEIRYEKLKLRSLPKRSLRAQSLKGKNQNRWVPNWVRSKTCKSPVPCPIACGTSWQAKCGIKPVCWVRCDPVCNSSYFCLWNTGFNSPWSKSYCKGMELCLESLYAENYNFLFEIC